MKTFKKIVFWILAIILYWWLIAYLLPGHYKVVRSVYIKSKPGACLDLTSNFVKWKLWVPWTKSLDSTAVFEMVGKGKARLVQSGDGPGKYLANGQMTSTAYVPGTDYLAYDLSSTKEKVQV